MHKSYNKISQILYFNLKAGALPLSIIISLLLLSLCSGLVLLNFLNISYIKREQVKIGQNDNAISGINICLSNPNDFLFNVTSTHCLYGDSTDIVNVVMSRWGAYGIVKSQALHNNHSNSKISLIGEKYSNKAIVLANKNKYLYLLGNTKIKGDCWLPGGVARVGSIHGSTFTGEQLVWGEQYTSEPNLPPISNYILSFINNNLLNNILSDSIIDYRSILNDKLLENSHKNKTLKILSEEEINLNNISLTGNIIIQSSKGITVDSTCNLRGVIIVAPKITFRSNFSGTLQAFASDSLIIRKKCTFNYPSFLASIGNNPNQSLTIDNESTVHGALILYVLENMYNTSSGIRLSDKCQVNGIVYSNTYTEILGKIIGTVYSNSFILNLGQTSYINYLKDAEISPSKLSLFYSSPLLFANQTSYSIIEWLN